MFTQMDTTHDIADHKRYTTSEYSPTLLQCLGEYTAFI